MLNLTKMSKLSILVICIMLIISALALSCVRDEFHEGNLLVKAVKYPSHKACRAWRIAK